MTAYMEMVNTQLNIQGVLMFMENDREHSELKNTVMMVI